MRTREYKFFIMLFSEVSNSAYLPSLPKPISGAARNSSSEEQLQARMTKCKGLPSSWNRKQRGKSQPKRSRSLPNIIDSVRYQGLTRSDAILISPTPLQKYHFIDPRDAKILTLNTYLRKLSPHIIQFNSIHTSTD